MGRKGRYPERVVEDADPYKRIDEQHPRWFSAGVLYSNALLPDA